MALKQKGEGFSLALEHIQSIYERLHFKKRLHKGCEKCPLMTEVAKMLDMVKDQRYEEIEKELGYYLV